MGRAQSREQAVRGVALGVRRRGAPARQDASLSAEGFLRFSGLDGAK
jgi:hypothetical protein